MQWSGFPRSTWEPAANLVSCQPLVDRFNADTAAEEAALMQQAGTTSGSKAHKPAATHSPQSKRGAEPAEEAPSSQVSASSGGKGAGADAGAAVPHGHKRERKKVEHFQPLGQQSFSDATDQQTFFPVALAHFCCCALLQSRAWSAPCVRRSTSASSRSPNPRSKRRAKEARQRKAKARKTSMWRERTWSVQRPSVSQRAPCFRAAADSSLFALCLLVSVRDSEHRGQEKGGEETAGDGGNAGVGLSASAAAAWVG